MATRATSHALLQRPFFLREVRGPRQRPGAAAGLAQVGGPGWGGGGTTDRSGGRSGARPASFPLSDSAAYNRGSAGAAPRPPGARHTPPRPPLLPSVDPGRTPPTFLWAPGGPSAAAGRGSVASAPARGVRMASINTAGGGAPRPGGL